MKGYMSHMSEKDYNKSRKRITISFVVLLVFLAVIVVGILALSEKHSFTQEKWHNDRENRINIVDSLVAKTGIIGMKEEEIIALLGNEDLTHKTSFKMSRKEFPPATTLIYYLGVEYMDSEWLIISLENGVATEYCIDVS